MEIKGIGGVINTYKSQKTAAPRKSASSASAKKTDRVLFGFDTALNAAKNAIAQEIKADASANELVQAQKTVEEKISASELASYILMG